MALRTRRSKLCRKSNYELQDEEIEIYEQQIKQAAIDQQVANKIKEHGQQDSVMKSQPKISQVARGQQAIGGQDMTLRTRKSIAQRKLNHRLQDEDVSHRLQDEEEIQEYEQQSTNQTEENEQQLQPEFSEGQGSSKKSRGPTYLPNLWARNSNEGRILVNFNKRGQPIGPNKKIFTGFLGTLARNSRFTPLDIEDWRKMPKIRKDELLRMVKERFEVPKDADHWILLSIGKKRRHWKSRVKGGSFVPTLAIENQAHNRPIRVHEDQWKNLLSYWAKEDVQEISDKNRDHRKCSSMQQTTGKISFAEVEEELKEKLGRSPSRVEMFEACYTDLSGNPSSDEVGVALGEMKEIQSKFSTDFQDSVGPSDTFSRVMGKEPRGRVRMIGLGVNPSDISGGVPSRSECYRMFLENQEALVRMEEKVNAATTLIASLTKKMQQNTSFSTGQQPTSPSQSSNSVNIGHSFQVGDEVLLKSLFNSRKAVAKGRIRSVDPNQEVGGKRLGLQWCEVQVSVPIEWDEELIRPYSNLSTIGDAIGTCVAWPHHLVKADDLD
ncbi:uncharacterized protein LOC131001460 [Salvia miltiorrhiza]|uniref:uncharacterized protein LOC130990400 n=1 Tax=Salvia miltiorrhiza TaxID=226208 RepID=UPI0025ABBF4D|nr:uncharacterized protein LOC130990400 [Salvia miltiorrhiza]XP_057783834.1 uncharacterized protein LOC131001460 [Salvia miltiorrhiza]